MVVADDFDLFRAATILTCRNFGGTLKRHRVLRSNFSGLGGLVCMAQ